MPDGGGAGHGSQALQVVSLRQKGKNSLAYGAKSVQIPCYFVEYGSQRWVVSFTG